MIRSSKSGLKSAMVEFPGVICVVVHRAAVDAPVADRPVPHVGRHLAHYFHSIGHHHLEPQVRPAQVANHRILVQLDLP